MKNLLVFLIPLLLLVGCDNEETEQAQETDLEETTTIVEDNKEDTVEENKNTNDKPVVKEEPVTTEKTRLLILQAQKRNI